MSLFRSNLRKQIRKLPKILKSVKIIQYYSILFIRVLNDLVEALLLVGALLGLRLQLQEGGRRRPRLRDERRRQLTERRQAA